MAAFLDDLMSGLNSDQGLLGLAMLSAAAPKERRATIGEGLLSGMSLVNQRRLQREEQAMREKEMRMREQDFGLRQRMSGLQEQQILQAIAAQKAQQEEVARQRALEQQFRDLIPSPKMQAASDALRAGGGPTVENAARVQPVDPMAQLTHQAMKLGQIKPTDYLASLRKDEAPMVVPEGATVLRGGKPVFTSQKNDLNNLVVRGPDGRPMLNQMLLDAKRQIAADGATRVSQSVNAEKPLVNTVATKLGEQIDASLANAKAATQAIGTAQTIKAAIDTGRVIAGPGSTFRVLGLQLGQMLGVGGSDAAEMLSNTRTVIQGLAKAELDAAQQMKGQGQITEAERDIIRRAASGNIDTMTGPEIRLLMDGMEKTARAKIAQHRANVQSLSKIDGAAPLLPFYNVEDPPAMTGGWSIRPKPAGGK